MQWKAIDICNLLGGTLEGNPDVLVSKPAKIEEGEPGAISFLANPKYEDYAYTCDSSVLLVQNDFVPKKSITATLIRVEDVYSCLSVLLEQFNAAQQQQSKQISKSAVVESSAIIGKETAIGALTYVGENSIVGDDVVLYPQVYIGNEVKIGAGTKIYPGARILDGTIIGKNCIIHANVVLGADGFGFAPQEDGSFKKIPQLGHVELEDEVEIGAGTTVDRATMGKTLIEKGAKLDNLIQVGHNVGIGQHTVIAAQTGIAGSTKIGNHCMIGGQAGFVGHISIANGTKIQAKSGVAKSIKQENQAYQGAPAIPYNKGLRVQVAMRNLPEILQRLNQLEKLVAAQNKGK